MTLDLSGSSDSLKAWTRVFSGMTRAGVHRVSVKVLGGAKRRPWSAAVHPDWGARSQLASLAGLRYLAGCPHPVCADCGSGLKQMEEALFPPLQGPGTELRGGFSSSLHLGPSSAPAPQDISMNPALMIDSCSTSLSGRHREGADQDLSSGPAHIYKCARPWG